MSFSQSSNNKPTDYFPGYIFATADTSGDLLSATGSSTGITDGASYMLIPVAAAAGGDPLTPLTDDGGLTSAEAHHESGNGNKVIYSLIKAAYKQLQDEETAMRPQNLTLVENQIQGLSVGSYSQIITMKAIFDISASDILDES